jgi:hypothetical protein
MLLKHIDEERRTYHPTPKRKRQNAHSKPLFWLAWAATSLLLWAIVVKVVPFPKAGTTWDFGIAPKSVAGKEAASWLGFGEAVK